jgi:molybdopterin converting factor small subunit
MPTILRSLADNQASVRAEGATVGEVFDDLVRRYPGLEGRIVTTEGTLHKFVNVYVSDDDIRYLDGLDTKVAGDAEISILPAVAGGAR